MAKSLKKVDNSSNIAFSDKHQTVYAEHLLRFALGPVVSKLDFGVVDDLHDESKAEIINTIVIPTENLINVLPLIIGQLENPTIQNGLIKKLDNIKESFKNFKSASKVENIPHEPNDEE